MPPLLARLRLFFYLVAISRVSHNQAGNHSDNKKIIANL